MTASTPLRLIAPDVPARDPMRTRAANLWPDSPRNQREWMRAVATVRRTRRGWLLDRMVPRKEGDQ